MAARRIITRIVSANGAAITVAGASADYRYGTLRWLDGANAGTIGVISESSGTLVTLREPSPFEPESGAMIELTEGCDKRFATCSSRFGNAGNFRGEPHLPGNDMLVRYAQ